MLAKSGRIRGVLSVVAASTFTVGLATVVGVVPRAGDVTTVAATDVRPVAIDETVIKPVETGPATTIPVTVPPMTEPPQPTETTRPPLPQSPVQPAPEVAAEPVLNVFVAPPPVQVPRRQPSAAEVDQAIAGLRPYVRSLFPVNPTHAQVAELGDNICTAFDEGQSVDQVKASGAQLVKKVPFATLLPGGDDYIIRTGVALYCPGHAPKLA